MLGQPREEGVDAAARALGLPERSAATASPGSPRSMPAAIRSDARVHAIRDRVEQRVPGRRRRTPRPRSARGARHPRRRRRGTAGCRSSRGTRGRRAADPARPDPSRSCRRTGRRRRSSCTRRCRCGRSAAPARATRRSGARCADPGRSRGRRRGTGAASRGIREHLVGRLLGVDGDGAAGQVRQDLAALVVEAEDAGDAVEPGIGEVRQQVVHGGRPRPGRTVDDRPEHGVVDAPDAARPARQMLHPSRLSSDRCRGCGIRKLEA